MSVLLVQFPRFAWVGNAHDMCEGLESPVKIIQAFLINVYTQRALQFSKENDPLSKYMTVRWFIVLAGTTWPSSIYTKSVSIADAARCYITQPGLLGTALTAAARQRVKYGR